MNARKALSFAIGGTLGSLTAAVVLSFDPMYILPLVLSFVVWVLWVME